MRKEINANLIITDITDGTVTMDADYTFINDFYVDFSFFNHIYESHMYIINGDLSLTNLSGNGDLIASAEDMIENESVKIILAIRKHCENVYDNFTFLETEIPSRYNHPLT